MLGRAGAAPGLRRAALKGPSPWRLCQAACPRSSGGGPIPSPLSDPGGREGNAGFLPGLSSPRGSTALARGCDPGAGWGRTGNAGLVFNLLCDPRAHARVMGAWGMAAAQCTCLGVRGGGRSLLESEHLLG